MALMNDALRVAGPPMSTPNESHIDFRETVYDFLEYLRVRFGVGVASLSEGSLLITVTCSSLQILDGLWEDYCSGHLNKVVEQKLVTPDVLERLQLSDLKLKTTITEEEYKKCKELFLRDQISGPKRLLVAQSRQPKPKPKELRRCTCQGVSGGKPTHRLVQIIWPKKAPGFPTSTAAGQRVPSYLSGCVWGKKHALFGPDI
ncbi:hypothetical protein OS493_004457 [Desmophyllum pertusum]|uniref:TRADD-like N-terminal domain-containing protein n=1 Tax=Desmophyllum pertusum TaxID=174260 RepID=A0A9W9ZJ36_9CNID|nr:hypothetical protein OS493_004457 [Desmophyllum pertusum]